MHVTFHGAAREVTGSAHLLETGENCLLMDCGLFQGRRKETNAKNRELPFDAGRLTNVVLSHAHIDHSGRIPLLAREAFKGRILSTRATRDACQYMLRDSAHIQESDANYLNYKMVRNFLSRHRKGSRRISKSDVRRMLKKSRHDLDTGAIDTLIQQNGLDAVKPLYAMADAEQALSLFDGYPYRHPVTVGRDMVCTFYEAGHILGSAISIIRTQANGRPFAVGFTGDIGRFDKPILRDPCRDFNEPDRQLDLLIMESTYGDRFHEPVINLKPRLKTVIQEACDREGTILIPSFAFGRTQELLYVLHELYMENAVPRLPVYVDSPLATRITKVFGEHPEVYDRETHETFLENGLNPFRFDQIRFVQSVEESIALNRDETPHIVISASGMCEAGRILHHLRYKIHNPKNTILIVGFMARHTLGRRILDQGEAYAANERRGPAPEVKFMNKTYPLAAHVVKIGGFSAHADRNELMRFLTRSNLEIKKIAVVHGEEEQSLAFTKHLNQNGYKAVTPQAGERIALG
ncbi:MAG: MBL fold metallo-hydrolase [Desulfosarcina sp.]|nr:MBL fold metallo-hydrolase [Desulfobacterales bacterium]